MKEWTKLKPAIARIVIFRQQYEFDIIHKNRDTIRHVDALSRYIPNTNIEGTIEPLINDIKWNYGDNSGPIDINTMYLGELTLQKVRQLQKLNTFL